MIRRLVDFATKDSVGIPFLLVPRWGFIVGNAFHPSSHERDRSITPAAVGADFCLLLPSRLLMAAPSSWPPFLLYVHYRDPPHGNISLDLEMNPS